MNVLVTGGTGLVGRSLRAFLSDAIYLGQRSSRGQHGIDLRDQHAVQELFNTHKYDAVIHLASHVGGIVANSGQMYDFFIDNVRINTNVLDACVSHQIPRVIVIGSSCAYPKSGPFPLKEENLHDGPAEDTNFAYAYVKRMAEVQMRAACKQFGSEWTMLIPVNLYGPYDNFHLENAHVIPALIHKLHIAKVRGLPSLEIYGTGKPMRQFLFARDFAKIIASFLRRDIRGVFNVSPPEEYNIADAVEGIRRVVGYNGEIRWNGQLDGVLRKTVDTSKIQTYLAQMHFTPLRQGLNETYAWFKRQDICMLQ